MRVSRALSLGPAKPAPLRRVPAPLWRARGSGGGAMTTYACRIVDVDDQAIARQIFAAANDIAAIETARHLLADTRGDAIEAWEGERLVYRERLYAMNDAPDVCGL